MQSKGTKGAWGEDSGGLSAPARVAHSARNYSCRFGEIDIIAADRHYVVFVEVKLRASGPVHVRAGAYVTPPAGAETAASPGWWSTAAVSAL